MQLVLSVAKSLLLIPGTGGCIPSKLVLATANVQLEVSMATLVRQDLASHTHSGTYKSRIAHFKEYRSLETHSCQGIDVKRVRARAVAVVNILDFGTILNRSQSAKPYSDFVSLARGSYPLLEFADSIPGPSS